MVIDAQLLVIQGVAQGAGQFDTLMRVSGQFLAVKCIAFSAAVLGLEQGRIGIAQYLSHIVGVVGVQADADAGGDKQLLLMNLEGRTHARLQALR